MRELRGTVRGQVDEESLEAELARAVAAAESEQGGDAEYVLQTLLREAAAALGEFGNSDVALARRALARSKGASGASHQALEQYRLVVSGQTHHGVQLDNVDLKFLLMWRDWATLLAALSRSRRQDAFGVEQTVLIVTALRGLGRDPLLIAREDGGTISLTSDAATALTLLAAIDTIVRGGTDSWTAPLARQLPCAPEWREAVAGIVNALAHDDLRLLVNSVRQAAELSRAAPAPVADLAVALCAWGALSADPLADDLELGEALAMLAPQTHESAAMLGVLISTYRLVNSFPEPLPEGSAASLAALSDISSLVAARAHLLQGERKRAADELGSDASCRLFLPKVLRRVLSAHARVGDYKAMSPGYLTEALEQSVSLAGVSASITATIREALVLLQLRKGNVGKAAAELVAWNATAPRDSRVAARHVLASALVVLGGRTRVPDFDTLSAVSHLGWRAQARLLGYFVSDPPEQDNVEPDSVESGLVGPGSPELDAAEHHLEEQLGVAHPIIVARAIVKIDDQTTVNSVSFAERTGRLADWMLTHGYNAFLRVFTLRVAQGDRLLKLGHIQHAIRVLTYATKRLDDLLPESRELRAHSRLLWAQAQIADRDFAGTLETLALLNPVTPGQRAVAVYFAAMAQQGLGDIRGACDALTSLESYELDGMQRFGVTADAVKRRRETIRARIAESVTEQIA